MVAGTGEAVIVLPQLAGMLKQLRASRTEILTQVEAVVEAHPLPTVLTSIPAVRVRTEARIITEVAGKEFKTAGHLASYAGLAPVTWPSGTSIRGDHPAKKGNKNPKRAFFLSAFAALKDPLSRAYYDRKRAEGKRHNQALIALARRRCFRPVRDAPRRHLLRSPDSENRLATQGTSWPACATSYWPLPKTTHHHLARRPAQPLDEKHKDTRPHRHRPVHPVHRFPATSAVSNDGRQGYARPSTALRRRIRGAGPQLNQPPQQIRGHICNGFAGPTSAVFKVKWLHRSPGRFGWHCCILALGRCPSTCSYPMCPRLPSRNQAVLGTIAGSAAAWCLLSRNDIISAGKASQLHPNKRPAVP